MTALPGGPHQGQDPAVRSDLQIHSKRQALPQGGYNLNRQEDCKVWEEKGDRPSDQGHTTSEW